MTVFDGETVAVLGPNGAGKTTLLRALAGLVRITGHVELDGYVFDDSATNRHVPTEERQVGLVFQDHVLFPHMTVLQNVAFGLRRDGDQIAGAVLERGKIVQSGSPIDVTAKPRSRFVADLAGVNLLRGRGRGDHIELDNGATIAAPGAGEEDVFAVIHPHAVALYRAKPEGTPRNVWPARVEDLDLHAERVRVRLGGPVPLVAEVTTSAVRDLHLEPGTDAWVAVKATEISANPA